MADNAIVDYTEFDATKLIGDPVEEKQIQGKTEKYKQLSLKYNYGTPEKPIITDCYYQFPPCKTSGVLTKNDKEQPNKAPSYSMQVRFSSVDDQHKLNIAQITNLYNTSVQLLFQQKGVAGLPKFTVDSAYMIYRNPIYFPTDKMTGEIIQGRDPNMYLKLISYKGGRTLFSYPDKNDVDPKTGKPKIKNLSWEELDQVDMTFIPLVKFEKIYIGSKCSMQCKIVSAIVVSVVKMGSQTRQLSTVEKLLASQPNFSDLISSQVASLRMENQDKFLGDEPAGQGQGQGQEQTSFVPNMYGQQSQPVQSSMDDFLGRAPTTNMVQSSQSSPSYQGSGFNSQTIQLPSVTQGQTGATTIKLN
jgi:hypothetical protein